MRSIKEYIRIPIKEPFQTERDFAEACKDIFNTTGGKKVLEQLLLDYDYHIPDSYSLFQKKYSQFTWEDFLKYRAAQKEVLAHLLFGKNAEYDLKQEETDLLTNEEY